jgi:uncharacterized protein (DUF2267 family)
LGKIESGEVFMAERKLEPKLTEAAAKTTAVLQTLQSRLRRETAPLEARDELGEELQRYFATAGSPLPEKISKEIRDQVIDGVVERILRSWGEPNGQVAASIKSEVITRLVERVTAEVLKKGVEL